MKRIPLALTVATLVAAVPATAQTTPASFLVTISVDAGKPAGELKPIWRPGFAYHLIEGGWNAPPKDYAKWGELVYQWTRHNIERYGRDEVKKWYFEVWNEPNYDTYWIRHPHDRYADRLPVFPCQGQSTLRRGPRANGHPRTSARYG